MKDQGLVLVDGANLYKTMRRLKWDLDWAKVLKWHREDGLFRLYYFTAIKDRTEGEDSLAPTFDWMDYHGITMVTKPVKVFNDSSGTTYKGNMDVEIVICALELIDVYDWIVLYTGDGDFKPLVTYLKSKGKFVTIVSSTETTPSSVSDDLRREADQFLELMNLKEKLSRI